MIWDDEPLSPADRVPWPGTRGGRRGGGSRGGDGRKGCPLLLLGPVLLIGGLIALAVWW